MEKTGASGVLGVAGRPWSGVVSMERREVEWGGVGWREAMVWAKTMDWAKPKDAFGFLYRLCKKLKEL